MKVNVDLSVLKAGEVMDFEDAAGASIVSLAQIDGDAPPPMRVMLALTWIMMRRADPGLTWLAFRDLPFDEVIVAAAPLGQAAATARRTGLTPTTSRPSGRSVTSTASRRPTSGT